MVRFIKGVYEGDKWPSVFGHWQGCKAHAESFEEALKRCARKVTADNVSGTTGTIFRTVQ